MAMGRYRAPFRAITFGLCLSLAITTSAASISPAAADEPVSPLPKSLPAPQDPNGQFERLPTQKYNLNLPASTLTPPNSNEEHRIQWTYKKISATEIAITAVSAGVAIGTLFMQPGPVVISGTDPVDEAARNTLRASTPAGRAAADTTSTVLLGSLAIPLIADAVAVTWVGDHNSSAALQMLAMDAMSISMVLGVDGLVKNIAVEPRPCTRDGASACTGPDSLRSFFSQHTALAFTGAGLICAQHQHLHLYGNPLLDGGICGLAIATAATVGVLRSVGDDHYLLRDVGTGALVGVVAGYLAPSFLHFGFGHSRDADPNRDARDHDRRDEAPRPSVTVAVTPMLSSSSAGAMISGTFE